MRNTLRLQLLAMVLLVVGLTGCKSNAKESPSQLDIAYQAQAQTKTAEARPTFTPWPTPWPTATRAPQLTAHPTATPFPTKDRSGATEEALDTSSTIITPGDWLTKPFVDETGQERTLAEFLGRAVVLETLSASCEPCIEQQQYLLAAIKDRYDLGLLTDTVFLALSVQPNESPSLVKSVLQDQLGEDWATIELLQSDETAADYIFGVASEDLRGALESTFGPNVLIPENITVIVIETDGLAHLMPEGIVSFRDLRDAISAYGNRLPAP